MNHNLPIYDDDGNYYDYHTLYVDTNGLSKQLVHDRMNSIFRHLKLSCTQDDYYLNYIEIKGKHNGRAYIYIPNSKVFFAIVGWNMDGNPRFEYEEYDLEFTPPKQPLEEALDDLSSGKIDDWSVDEQSIRELYKPKKRITTNTLPSLIHNLPGVLFVGNNVDDYDWKQYAKKGDLVIMRARIQGVYEDYLPYKLISSQVDRSVKINDMQYLFSMFSSNSTYPQIKLVNSKYNKACRFIISFDPATRDACFALLLTKVIKMKKPNIQHTIYMDYCKNR